MLDAGVQDPSGPVQGRGRWGTDEDGGLVGPAPRSLSLHLPAVLQTPQALFQKLPQKPGE